MPKPYKILIAITIVFAFQSSVTSAKENPPDTIKTRVIFLGTGNPFPSPDRAGPAVAVVHGDRFFLFDVGANVQRRINAAGLPVSGPDATFITHLHSDHTLGYPDLILTSWVIRRKKALQVYGPPGLQKMTDHILEAWSEDIDIRIKGLERERPEYLVVQVHEIRPGVVYDSAGIKITAIPVVHGNFQAAFGYRFDSPDRSIVISGDTSPSEALIKASEGVDILIHEVYASEFLKPENRPGGEFWVQYNREVHTSDVELGTIAKKVKPKVLVLTHIGRTSTSNEALIEGIRKGGYQGKVIIAEDLLEL